MGNRTSSSRARVSVDSDLSERLLVPEQNGLTPEAVVRVLEGRGWTARIVKESEISDLVDVGPTGLMKCVDGRPSDHPGMNGPKTLGGVYGIASNRGVTSIEGLKSIVSEVRKAGYIPSVHGDNHADPAPMGCGFYKLWVNGKLEGLPPPEFDSEQGKAAVLEAGGVYEGLIGAHEEAGVVLNFVPKTTLEPKADRQRFVLDAWVAYEFNLDIPKYLVSGASTVEQLNGPKQAILVVPDDEVRTGFCGCCKSRIHPQRALSAMAEKDLTAEDVVQVLHGRGWEAEIVKESDISDLVDVSSTGLMKCVDGRPSDHPGMNGPKTLGGVYAIASNRGVTSIEGLMSVVAEVRRVGYIPSVHGDNHADPAPMGCGFYKLWRNGKLEGLPPPEFDAAEGRAAVLNTGGVYEELFGAHEESEVIINFVPKTTLEPKAGNQRFVLDAWVAYEFNLDIPKYLVSGASTVEQLNGPRKARLIVPNDVSSGYSAFCKLF